MRGFVDARAVRPYKDEVGLSRFYGEEVESFGFRLGTICKDWDGNRRRIDSGGKDRENFGGIGGNDYLCSRIKNKQT
ncbi:MAG: hypothetical protein K2K75_05460 [Muribaculaceae bacterium]|nr:hypothetical protein [Muribaculaceae bacterium]